MLTLVGQLTLIVVVLATLYWYCRYMITSGVLTHARTQGLIGRANRSQERLKQILGLLPVDQQKLLSSDKSLDKSDDKNFLPSPSNLEPLPGGDLNCEEPKYDVKDQKVVNTFNALLPEYALFHNEGIQLLQSGQLNNVRTLTWYCAETYECGGLGTRFRGFMATLTFAILTNRVLLFRWDHPSAENVYLLPNKVDWQYRDYSLKLTESFKDLGLIKRLHLVDERYKYLIDDFIDTLVGTTSHVQVHYNPIEKLVSTLCRIIDNLHNPKLSTFNVTNMFDVRNYPIVESLSYKFLFKFTRELQVFANEVRNNLNLYGKKYVAVHLRTGQFSGSDIKEKAARVQNSLSGVRFAVECAIKQADKYIGPDAPVVVVSDSSEMKQTVSKGYSRVVILENNVLVHVDKSKNISKEGMLGTWQDIIIMAESHIVVMQPSSFPLISVAMCGITRSRTKIITATSKCRP